MKSLMQKREANWQSVFGQYLRDLRKQGRGYGHYELKQTSRESLPFAAIEQHQIEGLMAARDSGFVWKYSDQDQRQKPFDCSSMPPMPAYLAVKFTDAFYIMEIGVLMDHIKEDPSRRSLTRENAEILSERILTV